LKNVKILLVVAPKTCVLRGESIISHQDTADIPVLMLANKQDLPSSLKVEEIQQAGFTRIAEALSARDSKVLPISALTGYHYLDLILL